MKKLNELVVEEDGGREMKTFAIAAVAVFMLVSPALGSVIYEDVIYWLPGGGSVINPTSPPIDALVKIQETVYDVTQSLEIVTELAGFGLISGPAAPGVPFELYAYAITNLNYGKGAGGAGNGVSGFNSGWSVFGATMLAQWAPVAANTPWINAGFSGTTPEWDNPSGLGILKSQSAGGFLAAAAAGTPHGFVGFGGETWVHTWVPDGVGGTVQADIVTGLISAPLPEPATIGLLTFGLVLGLRRRAR